MLSRRTFTRTVLSSLAALGFAGGRTARATVAGTPLLKPAMMGDLALPYCMIMAPMTRGRAGEQRTATALMAEYYAQRAGAGLIVTEGTAISEQGYGWIGSPGIYTHAHALGWKQVTAAVHQRGGRVFLQVWHRGRPSHPDFLDARLPIAPSAVMAYGNVHTPFGKKPYVLPREMTEQEISGTVGDYARATHLAREAGFDGVEVHAAYGYLIDQFIRDGSNRRTDKYGGSVTNRLRFLLEVTEAVSRAWSARRVGVRLSPASDLNSMSDSDPVHTFVEATKELSRSGLAYLHVVESVGQNQPRPSMSRIAPHMRAVFDGSFILNGGYDASSSAAALDVGESDLIAFGRPLLANSGGSRSSDRILSSMSERIC